MMRRLAGIAATAVLGAALIGGAGAHTAAAADPLPTTVTLPLFGAPLTIAITTGPGGALTEVAVDPANGTVSTNLKAHKVVFERANPTDATDVARVIVRSHNGEQKVSSRGGSLADVSGPGMWSGDVFGDGTTSTVAFTAAAAGGGGPDITGIATTGATAVVGTVQHGSGDGDDNAADQSAQVSVTFTNAADDQSRTLSIKVKVDEEEGKAEARLSLALGSVKGVAVDAASATGPHSWTGMLCDGTAATIGYTVAADGSISGVSVTPATADVRTKNDRIDARFSHDERVRIRVRSDGGLIRIDVEQRLRCDSPDPTTNASTSIPAGNNDGSHAGGDDHGPADRRGGNVRGDHKGEQRPTVTTEPGA